MVRKRIRRILSGGAVVFIVLLCTLGTSYAGFDGVKIEWTISGSTGVSGVTMTGLPSQAGQTVVTDDNGYYSATVPYAWSGTVKPAKEGWSFEPATKLYQRVTGHMNNEDYQPTEITHTVSGKVTGPDGPMADVQMSGLPDSPLTGPDGSYSSTVPYGWGATVTPIKEGFTFTPSNKGYAPVKSNQIQNYTAAAKKLLMTGTVGTVGVKMNGLPGDPVTGANGVFSVKVDYNWTGTITPEKEGYEFEPAELQYLNIITDQTNENFNAKVLTYVISGTAGMAGVEMKGLPGTYTDQNGYFDATVNHGFSGTVTPWKEGYKFDPASFILAKVNSDRTNLTCSAEVIKLTISGTTRLEGVQMTGLPGNPITDKDGKYSVVVDHGWNGTVMPVKDGYKFTPESRPYPLVTTDTANQTYTYSKITYTINGSAGVAGVILKGFPGRAVSTTVGGTYSATVEHGWSGTVTPYKEGYQFDPASAQFTSIMGPQSGQDFTPTLLQRKISGVMRSSKGQPVEGVNVVANNNGGQAVTDTAGKYELVVDYGWNGTLTPLKEGYTFSPSVKSITRVAVDQLNQFFTATARMFTVTGVVKVGGIPIDGVLITASDGSGTPITATTDLKGNYTFKVPFGWTGEVAPTKEGIGFNPPSQSLIDVRTNIKDFQPVTPAAPPRSAIEPTPTSPAPDTRGPGPAVVPPGPTPPVGMGPGSPAVVPPGPTPPTEVTPLTPEQVELRDLRKQVEILINRGAARPAATLGQLPDPGIALISNSWQDGELALEVLPLISEQAGIPIMVDEAVTAYVTITLESVPLEQALDLVLAGTPYVWKRMEGYYLVGPAGLTDSKFSVFSETRRVRMNYITAEAAVNLLSTAFRPYAQSEIAQLEVGEAGEVGGTLTSGTRMPKTYTVVVTAPPLLLNRIVADLKSFDKIPDQVLLKARIVAMARTDLLNLGVEWGWPTMQLGFFSGNNYGQGDPLDDFGGKSPWGIQMGYTPDLTFTNSLQLALNLLTVNGEATIRAEPQVLAQDGKRATMKVVNEEYFFLTADTSNNTQNFFTNSQLETIESGTTLTITPHIVENDRVVLQISVEVSDSVAAGRETDLPIVTRRTADNTVTVQNGGTVALAGLTQEKSATSHRRTPGLSNLPLIGGLFNNSNDVTTSREVAVFVTAHILPQNQYDATASIPRAAPVPTMPQRFSMPPSELDGRGTLTDPRFNQPPVDQGFSPAPVDSRFSPAPVDSRFNQPAPGPAPRRPMGTNFQEQLRESMTRNQ